MVEKYRKGGAEKRDVISDLIKVVDANLRLVTVTAPTLEVLYFSRLATKLYSPENRKLTIFEKAELNRRFAKVRITKQFFSKKKTYLLKLFFFLIRHMKNLKTTLK